MVGACDFFFVFWYNKVKRPSRYNTYQVSIRRPFVQHAHTE